MLISTTPLMDAPGDGFGGGPANAGPTNGAPAVDTAPQPISLTDDSLITVDGQKEPVKYGEWKNRFVDKSQYTKVTQDRAAREKQWADHLAAVKADYESRLKQTSPNAPVGGASQFDQELQQLANATYVDGKTAASLVSRLVKDGIGGLAESIKQRDQVIALLYKKLEGVGSQVSEFKSSASKEALNGLYTQVRADVQLPNDPVIKEFLEDIYWSHTGNDLNQEFPKMVRERWSQLVAAVRAWDKANAAKQRTEGLPGRGGAATPSKPVKRGFQSAEDIAKEWFPLIREGANNT